MYLKLSSDYELQEKKDGFVVEAERLNKTVEKEYELKKGDTIQEDGAYQIVCKGRNAKGSIAFKIKKS